MKVNDIVRIKETGSLGRVRKLKGKSANIREGIVVKAYVYKEEDLELIDIHKLSKHELKQIVEELIK